jgi:outer membrane protein TolC
MRQKLGALCAGLLFSRAGLRSLALVLGLGILCGCTASHYRRQADRDVYRIVQNAEQRVLGHTNEFNIDTAYSKRKPKDIKIEELVDDRLQTNRRVLTIEDALKMAALQSRRYQTEKERLYLSALTLTESRHSFRPQFAAGSAATMNRSTREEWRGMVANDLSVGQLLQSGGNISLSLANDILRYYSGDPRQSVASTLSVNLAQPLLRGFGRNNPSVENLTQAVRNVIYAVRSYSQFQNQFAMDVVNDYFDLLQQKDVVRNRYTNYLSRGQSTQRLEARAKDREQLANVDQARQSELTAKNNYVNEVARYLNLLDQFKITLGMPLGEHWDLDDTALDDLKKAGLIDVKMQIEEVFRIAVHKQWLILNAIDKYEDVKRKVGIAANRLKMELNIIGDASWKTDPYPDYTRFSTTNLQSGFGLQLNLPLDRLSERNTYRASLISFEAELRNLTLTLDNLRDSIARGLRTLEQRRQNYDIQRNALDLADRRVTSTTLLMQAGRAEIRDLIEAQDAQISAQNSVTAALVEFQTTRMQLMLDIGALNTDVPQFWIKDQMAGYAEGAMAESLRDKVPDASLVTPDVFFRK